MKISLQIQGKRCPWIRGWKGKWAAASDVLRMWQPVFWDLQSAKSQHLGVLLRIPGGGSFCGGNPNPLAEGTHPIGFVCLGSHKLQAVFFCEKSDFSRCRRRQGCG